MFFWKEFSHQGFDLHGDRSNDIRGPMEITT